MYQNICLHFPADKVDDDVPRDPDDVAPAPKVYDDSNKNRDSVAVPTAESFNCILPLEIEGATEVANLLKQDEHDKGRLVVKSAREKVRARATVLHPPHAAFARSPVATRQTNGVNESGEEWGRERRPGDVSCHRAAPWDRPCCRKPTESNR